MSTKAARDRASKALYERRKLAGYTHASFWIKREWREAINALIKKLDKSEPLT